MIDIVYRCVCSWVGGDPDYHRGKATCPACWHHDRKRVAVQGASAGSITDEQIRACMQVATDEHDARMVRWCEWALGDVSAPAHIGKTYNARAVVAKYAETLNARSDS